MPLLVMVLWALGSCEGPAGPSQPDLSPVSSWEWADGGTALGLNVDPGQSAHYPQLTSDSQQLHVTWFESTATANQIRLATMNHAGDGWVLTHGDLLAGINADPAADAEWSRLARHDGALYASWHEWSPADTAFRIRIARIMQAPPSGVEFVDSGGLHAGSGYEAIHASVVSFEGQLYASWREQQAGDGKYQVRIARLSTGWEFVDRGPAGGVNYDPDSSAYYPKLAVHRDELHIIWHEKYANGRTVHVSRFDPDAGPLPWVRMDPGAAGLNFNPDAFADGPQILSAGEILVALWTERVAGLRTTLRVSAYADGWEFLDGGLSGGLSWGSAGSVRWARAAVGTTGEPDDLSAWLFVSWSESTSGSDVVRVAARRIVDAYGNPAPVELGGAESGWLHLSGESGLSFEGEGDVEYPHAVFHDSDLYVAFSQMIDRTFRVRVARANLRWE